MHANPQTPAQLYAHPPMVACVTGREREEIAQTAISPRARNPLLSPLSTPAAQATREG